MAFEKMFLPINSSRWLSSSSSTASIHASMVSRSSRRIPWISSGPTPIGALKDKYGRLIQRRVRVFRPPHSAAAGPGGRHVSAAPNMETLLVPRSNLLDANHLHVRFPGGIYLRIPRKLPKIPAAEPAIVPKPLAKPIAPTSTPSALFQSPSSALNPPHISSGQNNLLRKSPVFVWFRENLPTIILNLGSLATLTAFTRSDILELRILSITGSLSSITYSASKRMFAPMIWSSVFVLTNSYMLYKIYIERQGTFHNTISMEELHAYQEFFYPYGVTPRQFGLLLSKAKKTQYPKGTIVQSSHVPYQKVYLVLSGKTEARAISSSSSSSANIPSNAILTRRITAAGSVVGNNKSLIGGDAGAWIGEEAFLEEWGIKSSLTPPALSRKMAKKLDVDEVPNGASSSTTTTTSNNNKIPNSLLEYSAVEDSVVLEWTHEDLFQLLSSASSDFRAAIPRAMTGAVVGKVVNMYSSNSSSPPPTPLPTTA